jgi:hypothetical protein
MTDRFCDNSADHFLGGIFPELDDLSLTVCPVHALSSSREWIEMAWAARNAAHDGINLARRGWFEGVKCLLLERDLPASRTFPRQLSSGERQT